MSELTRRNFLKLASAAAAISALPSYVSAADKKEAKNMSTKIVPGAGGEHYVSYDRREGPESYVYFTRNLSAAGLIVKPSRPTVGRFAPSTSWTKTGQRFCLCLMANGSTKCPWGKIFCIMIPSLRLPTSKDTPWVDLAGRTRISVSVAPTDALARNGYTPKKARINGA